MINKISFTGKAYFLEKINKTIAPKHKKGIENYAHNLSRNSDVVVFSQEQEKKLFYQGQPFNMIKFTCGTKNDGLRLEIKVTDGIKEVPIEEIEVREIPLPFYNAYIFDDYNKKDLYTLPYKKQFYFTDSANNTANKAYNDTEKSPTDY